MYIVAGLLNLFVFNLQAVLGVAWAAGEEAETTPVEAAETPSTDKEVEDESATKSPEKRGLFRLTGVHGENPQYQFLYTVPQQIPAVAQAYEPRAAAAGLIPKYEPLMKMFPSTAYSIPSPAYPQAYSAPSAAASYPSSAPAPIQLSAPTAMILMMVPPHAGQPYPQLMLVPYNNIASPNHILPYQQPRVPIQLVPQFVPLPIKGYGQYPSAHFKSSEYSQKPQSAPQQYLSSHSPQYQSSQQYLSSQSPQYQSSQQYLSSQSPQYQSSQQYLTSQSPQYQSAQQYLTSQSPQYQEAAAGSEEQDVSVTSGPPYNTRVPYRSQSDSSSLSSHQ